MNQIKRVLANLESKVLIFTHLNDYQAASLHVKKENSLLKFSKCGGWLTSQVIIKKQSLLDKRNIKNVYDLLLTKPLRQEHYTKIVPILSAEGTVCVEGVVTKKVLNKYYSITINDGVNLECKWFNTNQILRHIFNNIKVGQRIVCEGKIVRFGLFKEMHHPRIRTISAFKPHIDIIYPSFGYLTNNSVKKIIQDNLANQPRKPYDFLPYTIILRRNLPFLSEVFEYLHIKSDEGKKEIIEKRLKYEELFLMQLGLALEGNSKKQKPIKIAIGENFLSAVEAKLPFELTLDQKKAIDAILKDLKSGGINSRLLQGDVGCGKTIVALISALAVLKSGRQVCIMSPTTTLAEQTFLVARNFFSQYGFLVEFLINTTKKKGKILDLVKNNKINCMIGTHALLNENLEFNNLGFLVIDEQHRFGVNQRKALQDKGENPYVLIMSATPIPRSLAFTLYGKTKIIEIKELPKNRKPVKTIHLLNKESQVAYLHARDEILNNHQVYIVFALIENSDLKTNLNSLLSSFEVIRTRYFKEFKCAFLHSNLKADQKSAILEDFKNGKLHCLMSTTVIEVGIDAPNSTIMIIENAENFGLAQLHQLRGRVGRSHLESFCYLITNDHISQIAKNRIKVLLSTNNGFDIAMEDLKLRGSGEIYSTNQHGLPDLEFADILSDRELLEKAQNDAYELVKLKYPLNDGLLKVLEDKWQKKFDYARVL